MGSGIGGAAAAGDITVGLGIGRAAMSGGLLRRGLQRFVFPESEPVHHSRRSKTGRVLVTIIGRRTATDGPFTVMTRIGAAHDSGYGATSQMLGEAAICLLRVTTELPLDGGILTPASGIGDPLADRLRDVGFIVEVGEWEDG